MPKTQITKPTVVVMIICGAGPHSQHCNGTYIFWASLFDHLNVLRGYACITEILPRLWRLLEHTYEQNTLTYRLKQKLGLKQLIGESLPFLDKIKKIPTIAKCDANVLISGETGTEKRRCVPGRSIISARVRVNPLFPLIVVPFQPS